MLLWLQEKLFSSYALRKADDEFAPFSVSRPSVLGLLAEGWRGMTWCSMQGPGPCGPFVLPGCTTLSFRMDLHLPLDQVRDHNLQSALISIWLSEGNSSDSQVPISTCTSSGCCWPAAQIQVKQESPFHKISGGESNCIPTGSFLLPLLCERGSNVMQELLTWREIQCVSSLMLANRVKWKAWL